MTLERRTPLPAILAAIGLAVCMTPAVSGTQGGTVVPVVGVSVVDPSTTLARRDDQTVIIRGDRIAAVGPRASTRVPSGARRIDGTGRFLIPGLWDAHVHFMNAGVTALPSFVANGITSVREMGGYIDSTRAWQARMRAGTLVGPRIITPGPILENPRYLEDVRRRDAGLGGRLAPRILPYRIGVADTADARRVMDSLAAMGVDFVKFRTVVSPAVHAAILREAHRRGLRVAGHAPGIVPPTAASESGQDDMEHALFPLSDSARAARARAFSAHGTWYTPTLVVSRTVVISGDSADLLVFGAAGARDPRRALASPWLLDWWRMQVDERIADTSSSTRNFTRQVVESSSREVGELARAGVRILAGTDAGSVLIYPGPSLHDELALLVEAGLSPQQALWSATVGPAQFARLDSTVGRIQPGFAADLVLVDADPLSDIRNTRRVRTVIQAGRVYDRAELDSLLAEVRRKNAS